MPDTTPPPVVATAEETAAFRSEQEREYGQFVALADISFNGARAYNAGDPVPATNVAKYGYDTAGLVAKVGTKAGAEAIRAIHANATTTPTADAGSPVSLNVTVPSSK